MRYSASLVTWYKLTSSVGRKPVPYIADSRTSTGGRTSSKPRPTSRSMAYLYKASSTSATAPLRYAKRAPETLAPRSRSKPGRPRPPPDAPATELSSTWSRGVNRNSAGLPDPAQLQSVLVRVAVGGGVVGRVRKSDEQLRALTVEILELGLGPPELLAQDHEGCPLLFGRLAPRPGLPAQLVDLGGQISPEHVDAQKFVEVRRGPLTGQGAPE